MSIDLSAARRLVTAAVFAQASLAGSIVLGDVIGTTTVVAETRDAAPDGNGSLSGFDRIALNDAGQVLFTATLTGTTGGPSDDSGLFRSHGTAAGLAQVAREGQILPDGDGRFAGFTTLSWGNPVFNNAGRGVFLAELADTNSGGNVSRGIYRGDGTASGLSRVARAGQAAPDGNGSFAQFFAPTINDLGQTAFYGFLTGTSGGSSDDVGLYFDDDTTGGVTRIARTGQAAPDGNGSFSSLYIPSLNDAGQVAFFAIFTGTSGGGSDNSGIYRSGGTTDGLTQIVREGQTAPDGNGRFSLFDISPVLNDAGQTAFNATLTGTSSDAGIFLSDDTASGLTQIARAGQVVPGGNGSFSGFFGPALNDAGQAGFYARLTGTSGGSSDDIGIFRGDGTLIDQVARTGDAAPGGGGDSDGVLSAFVSRLALNEEGQVAFLADIDLGDGGSINDERGLFFHDDQLGLISVIRTGDAFGGSTIKNFLVSTDGDLLNASGQVAYAYTLDDGREGVAIWTVPEPAATGLLGLASLALLLRRA